MLALHILDERRPGFSFRGDGKTSTWQVAPSPAAERPLPAATALRDFRCRHPCLAARRSAIQFPVLKPNERQTAQSQIWTSHSAAKDGHASRRPVKAATLPNWQASQ